MDKFNGGKVHFNKSNLNALIDSADSGVVKEHHRCHLALHPSQIGQFNKSVKYELNKKIAEYDQKYEGILLGYDNIKLSSKLGTIGIDSCYIHFDIDADFFIFKPEIGMVLNGIVTEKSKNHVGCVIYQTFNVSLPKDEKKKSAGEWIGREAKVGCNVQFKLTSIDVRTKMIHLRGELVSILQTNETPESVSDQQKKSKKKHKNKEELPPIDDQLIQEPSASQKKHKKHKHRSEEQIVEIPEKRKKIKEEEMDVDDLIGELDLGKLFENTSLDVTQSRHLMPGADLSRKRDLTNSWAGAPFTEPIKLEPDSDLESILGNKRRKKLS